MYRKVHTYDEGCPAVYVLLLLVHELKLFWPVAGQKRTRQELPAEIEAEIRQNQRDAK